MTFGFANPCIHHVDSVSAEAASLPNWRFASLTLTFRDIDGAETELEVYLPKHRSAFAHRIADAINAASVLPAETEAA